MKVTFLGTGTSQGVPLIACFCDVCISEDTKDKRLRSSIMIEVEGKNFVVDTGPDFRQQMLREKVVKLDAVLFTHEHKDHTAGLDDVRAFNFFSNRPMDVYATLRVQDTIKKEFAYIFAEGGYPGIPKLNLHTISKDPFEVDGIKVISIEVLHYKLPVLGFRIKDFTYITNANYISEEEKEKIKGSKVLVLNALRHETHISHFTLAEAVKLVEELKPEKAYLTHLSHQMGKHKDVENLLPENIHCAYDGLVIKL